MSGVIDSNGVQWEHCGGCKGEGTPNFSERGKWVRIEDLMYEPPSEEYKYGRDLCSDCASKSPTSEKGQTVTITIPANDFGMCARFGECDKPATVKEWVEFDNPIPAIAGLPEVKGVWNFVCEDHKEV